MPVGQTIPWLGILINDLTISFCFSGDMSALDPVDTLAPPRAELADNKPKKMAKIQEHTVVSTEQSA